jgi:hypothetical protein
MAVISAGLSERPDERSVNIAALRQQVADRDEIIVALQHVVRDLRHEIENLRAEISFAAFGRPAA